MILAVAVRAACRNSFGAPASTTAEAVRHRGNCGGAPVSALKIPYYLRAVEIMPNRSVVFRHRHPNVAQCPCHVGRQAGQRRRGLERRGPRAPLPLDEGQRPRSRCWQ